MPAAARAVDPIAVTELPGQAIHPDVPVFPGAVPSRVQCDLREGFRVMGFREDQPDRGGVTANQGEVDAARGQVCPERERVTLVT